MRWSVAASLLLLPACAGSVQLEEVDSFGGVSSAVWVYYEDLDLHQIALTNVGNACDKLVEFADAAQDYGSAIENVAGGGFEDYCEDLEDPVQRFAEAGDALYYEGAHWLTLSLEGGEDPDEDVYTVEGSPLVEGLLTYWDNSPYAAILEQFDRDAEDAFCGVDEDDLEQDLDSWTLEDGELEISLVEDQEKAKGRFEGQLQNENGDEEGDIRFSFRATYCELD